MEIHFEIENKCLLKCQHCSSNAGAEGRVMEYGVQEILSLLKELPGHKDIFFTGGEPLLYDGFGDLLKTLKEEIPDLSFGMFSAGILEKEGNMQSVSLPYARYLKDCGLNNCYFSIYSWDETDHDWMTGQKGGFQMTKKTIENFRRCGIGVRFNLVITNKNKAGLLRIIDLAEGWGIEEVRLLKLVPHGRAKTGWPEIGIEEEEYKNAVKMVLKEAKAVKITASGCIDLLPCRPFAGAERCQAGSNLLYVTFQGDIFPCASVKHKMNYRIGNVKEPVKWSRYFENRRSSREEALCSID